MKKVGKRENYIITYYTLNLGLFAYVKNYIQDWVSETQLKCEYFYRLLDLKKRLV